MKITRREFTKAGLGASTIAALGGQAAFAASESLISKAIPSSGEKIPIIGLGTNRYGVDTSEAARAPLRGALQRFHELGGKLIDTAPMYRTSEIVLGDLIAEIGVRDDLFIATKVDKTTGRDDSAAQIDESSARLKTQNFELMQVHNLRGWKESLPLLRELKEAGRIRYIGITTSRSSQYEALEEIIRKEDFDFVQMNYSLEQRDAAERLLPLAADRGAAVILNRAFGGGRIFDKVGNEALPGWAKEFNCESWAQFLLKYAVSHPAATVAIPGMTKAHHVDDNIGAAHGRLPTAEERKMQESFFDNL